MADFFDDFQMEPHYDHDGNLKGFTQKNILGEKNYFDENGNHNGWKVKNPVLKGSDYFDSAGGHLGHSENFGGETKFMKSDGSFGDLPKMFEVKDPMFHDKVHTHFSGERIKLLNGLK